ncbi:MAG: hypothetical protein JXR37_33840 [Kiritimatiellae bacterium]|nr:hypothetical protein [Kiritimatiellia bacterium]
MAANFRKRAAHKYLPFLVVPGLALVALVSCSSTALHPNPRAQTEDPRLPASVLQRVMPGDRVAFAETKPWREPAPVFDKVMIRRLPLVIRALPVSDAGPYSDAGNWHLSLIGGRIKMTVVEDD